MWSQKHNAEHASRIGMLASSTARADTSCEMTQQTTRSTSSPFHRYGKKEGDKEYFIANQLKKKRQFLNIHDRFIRDTWF